MSGTSSKQTDTQTGFRQGTTTGASSATSTGSLTPYYGTADLLSRLYSAIGSVPTGVSPDEANALSAITQVGQAGSPFAGDISSLAKNLLSGTALPDRTPMLTGALDKYTTALDPTARGDFLDPTKNPFFSNVIDTTTNDITKRINAAYAGAGRDPTGAGSYAYQLGRGVSEGTAPIFSRVYDAERARQLAAQGSEFGAAGSTADALSGLDRAKLASMLQGIPTAGSAYEAQLQGPLTVLNAAAQQRGIPLDALTRELGLVLPGAEAFGTRTGATTGQTSQLQNILDQMQGTRETQTPFNPLSLAPLAFLPLSGSGSSSLAGGLLGGLFK